MSSRVALAFAAFLCAACAEDAPSEQTSALLGLPGDAEIAAQSILRHTLAYHSAVTSSYVRVKGELQTNPYALVDELEKQLDAQRSGTGGDLEKVPEELLEHMQGAADDVTVVAEVYHLLRSYADLMEDPRRYETDPDSYFQYMWDLSYPSASMHTILQSPWPEQSQSAYYFAPAASLVAISRLVVEATMERDPAAVQYGLREATASNEHALERTDYVASRYAGDASVSAKNDADPVVYSIRRMLAEQQAALE